MTNACQWVQTSLGSRPTRLTESRTLRYPRLGPGHFYFVLILLTAFSLCSCTPALIVAARQNNLEEVQRLVEKEHADLDVRSHIGVSAPALVIAAAHRNADMVKYLVEKGANVNERMKYYKGDDSVSALIIAARNGHDQAVEFLKSEGLSTPKEKAVILAGVGIHQRNEPGPVGTIYLEEVDGKGSNRHLQFELEPGVHTVGLSYHFLKQTPLGVMTVRGDPSHLSITGETGHLYVIHANISGNNYSPVVRDYSIH